MLGKLNVHSPRIERLADGTMEIVFKVDDSGRYAARTIMDLINDGIAKGKERLSIAINWATKDRTIDQNDLMWSLIREICLHENGGRTTKELMEAIYLRQLKKYGTFKSYYILPEALDTFQRLSDVKTVILSESVIVDGVRYIRCEAVFSSRKFSTIEMSNLIDGLFDDIYDSGDVAPWVRQMNGEWQVEKNKKHNAKL